MMTWIPLSVHFGPLTLPVDRLSIIFGVLFGLYVLQKHLTRAGHQGNQIANVLFESLILSFFAALLSPVVLHIQDVISHPLTALFGGLTSEGSWVGVTVFVSAFAWKFRAVRPRPPIPALLDAFVAGWMIGWLLPSVAVEEYGVKTSLIGGAGAWYHPIFLYRTCLLLIGFWVVSRGVRKSRPGVGGAIGLVWIGWMQLLLSLVEADSPIFLQLTQMQVLGILLALGGIVLHRRFRRGT